MIRTTTLWALRALVYLASQPPDRLVLAAQVAEATGAPTGTMSKVLQRLSSAGLLVSQRGMQGGYALAQPSPSISVDAAMRAMSDPLVSTDQDADGTEAFPLLDALLVELGSQIRDRAASVAIADLVPEPSPHRPRR